MHPESLSRPLRRYRLIIFWILAFAYILVYFHRLCPAVVADDMMRDLHAGGTLLGFLGSAYFYPYALMQIPAGLLSDSWGPRRSITLFLLVACAGSFLMGLSPTSAWTLTGRVLVGLGVSTLFVSTLKILSEWFSKREFTPMAGILVAMGGLGSLSAAAPLAYVSSWIGWRMSFILVGFITLLIVTLVCMFVRDNPAQLGLPQPDRPREHDVETISLSEGFRMVISEPAFRPVAIWFFFNCAIFFSFVGLWGGPFLMHIYGVDKTEAGRVLSLAAVGLIIGSPLLGYLSDKVFQGRKPVLILSSLALLCLTALLAFDTGGISIIALYPVCLGIGLTAGASVVIGFSVVKELFPTRIAGTATGVVNLFPFAGGALFQPIMGALLERNGRHAGVFTLNGYREAFLALFLCGVFALLASLCIRETISRNRSNVP